MDNRSNKSPTNSSKTSINVTVDSENSNISINFQASITGDGTPDHNNNEQIGKTNNKREHPGTSNRDVPGVENCLSQIRKDPTTLEGEIINNLLSLVQMRQNIDEKQQCPMIFSKHIQEEANKSVSTGTTNALIPFRKSSLHSLASRVESVQEFELNITPPSCPPIVLYSAPPVHGAPPTYSAVMRLGPVDEQTRRSLRLFGRRQEVRMQPSPPFIAPMPPPTYAEAHGNFGQPRHMLTSPTIDLQETLWGPDPMSTVCPACGNFVITTVHTRRSNLTHFSALALCVCGCWPCCLLPYCMKSCKTSYHECPVCLTLIGMFNPL